MIRLLLIIASLSFSGGLHANIGALEENPNRPGRTCIGDPSWPVRAVYLHGWFTDAGNQLDHSRQTEFNNREILQRYAQEHQIRIALPLAQRTHQNGNLTWGGYNFARMESEAAAACNLSQLPSEGLTLFGYSSGGFGAKNAVRDHRGSNCSNLRRYRRIVAIGTNETYPNLMNQCNNILTVEPLHEFPPRGYNNLVQLLDMQRNQSVVQPTPQPGSFSFDVTPETAVPEAADTFYDVQF